MAARPPGCGRPQGAGSVSDDVTVASERSEGGRCSPVTGGAGSDRPAKRSGAGRYGAEGVAAPFLLLRFASQDKRSRGGCALRPDLQYVAPASRGRAPCGGEVQGAGGSRAGRRRVFSGVTRRRASVWEVFGVGSRRRGGCGGEVRAAPWARRRGVASWWGRGGARAARAPLSAAQAPAPQRRRSHGAGPSRDGDPRGCGCSCGAALRWSHGADLARDGGHRRDRVGVCAAPGAAGDRREQLASL